MKSNILILHGWGVSGSRYRVIQELLEKKQFRVFAPDLPGFGAEPLVKSVMDVDDYVAFVVDFIKKKEIKKAIIIGHSFGGRVGTKLASSHPAMVEKLILTGSPLIKQPLSLQKKLLQLIAQTGKKTTVLFPQVVQQYMKKGMYYVVGEWDYYKAGTLKETFKAVVAEDIAPLLPKIFVPTLVVWGSNDAFVSLAIGKEIAQRMPHATFVAIRGATHKLPYENPSAFIKAIIEFI